MVVVLNWYANFPPTFSGAQRAEYLGLPVGEHGTIKNYTTKYLELLACFLTFRLSLLPSNPRPNVPLPKARPCIHLVRSA
mmetsp:Transcript_5521/g.10541  ORF Transcript_5521/g.10541 Transcript_5521/m.10541 type:complete len:80 (+) Transcript_5521:307-546(+)